MSPTSTNCSTPPAGCSSPCGCQGPWSPEPSTALDGRDYAATESLRLLLHRDPAVLAVVNWVPGSGVAATHAMFVGGTVAALATMAVQLAGLLSPFPADGNSESLLKSPFRS
jgi:hypothetical protein